MTSGLTRGVWLTYRHDDAEYTDIRTQSFTDPGGLPEYADHTKAPRRKRGLDVSLKTFGLFKGREAGSWMEWEKGGPRD